MMKKLVVLFAVVFLILVSSSALQCQTENSKYWVFLSDKAGVEFDPYSYFDSKAIERRLKLGIDLYHISDFPLNEEYKQKVGELAHEVINETRWFNALSVMASKKQISEIKRLNCVIDVKSFLPLPMELAQADNEGSNIFLEPTENQLQLLHAQTLRMGRQDFADNGVNGKNVRIAIFDAGFTNANTNGCFEHIFNDNRVIDTYDFIKKEKDVYHGNHHGTAVWSCIAGITNQSGFGAADTIGLATGAEFLLARTERGLIEVFSEEENWLAAVEWADKNGADIINSSLGYTGHRYEYDEMNGSATLVSRAGNLAAKKGILVVNSAGNDGSNEWNFIGAPADADSVLAVGGLLPRTGIHTNFSSVGPTYDYRLKPNVTAYGHVMGAKHDYMSNTQGTSFSSPLMAGFAACAWQANPSWNNMELFKALELGADLYPYFDYAHGYGVPLAKNFLKLGSIEEKKPNHVLTELEAMLKISLNISVDSIKHQNEKIEEKDFYSACKLDYSDHLFYHFEDVKGHLISYHVVNMGEKTTMLTRPYPVGAVMFRSYYKGEVNELKLKAND